MYVPSNIADVYNIRMNITVYNIQLCTLLIIVSYSCLVYVSIIIHVGIGFDNIRLLIVQYTQRNIAVYDGGTRRVY